MSRSQNSDSPRLQKVLASAGFGSRRNCEALILEGRVEIDREVVSELGTRVDPDSQQIRVDGVAVKLPKFKYFALHKPIGVISTARDPWARTRVIDLVDDPDRLFTVGRLDKSSSGLILVTNDGDLAHQLTHPKFRVEKTYRVVVAGRPTQEAMRQLRKGVYLSDGKAHVERIAFINARANQSNLEIVLSEGRNREIRRLLARVGHKVQQLKRIAFGPLRLGELPVGAYRELSRQEVAQLREAVSGQGVGSGKKKRPGRKHDTSGKKQPRQSTAKSSDKSTSTKQGKAGTKGKAVREKKRRVGSEARQFGSKKPQRSKRTATKPAGTVIGGDVASANDDSRSSRENKG